MQKKKKMCGEEKENNSIEIQINNKYIDIVINKEYEALYKV
jgi:hypothetical protein